MFGVVNMTPATDRPLDRPLFPTRLRQIALVVEDLARARYLLTNVLGTEVIFIDPGVAQWGLQNILVAIGGDFIEVVSPTRPNTTAGRLLSKRGDGGYMIIMQTSDAAARHSYLEAKGLAKSIFSYKGDDFVCVQYHPKGIKGGMMPEIDSHRSTPSNPNPLMSRFSPWHTCGHDYSSYSNCMKHYSHLRFVSVECRLAPVDEDTQAAARQWEELVGVTREEDELVYTNLRMKFLRGEKDKKEGLHSITIAVEGREKFNTILNKAREEGLCGDGWINMLGVRWYFVLVGEDGGKSML